MRRMAEWRGSPTSAGSFSARRSRCSCGRSSRGAACPPGVEGHFPEGRASILRAWRGSGGTPFDAMPLFDDSALVAAARAGDADAFAAVHERVFRASFGFVSQVTGDDQLAEETAGRAALDAARELAAGGDPETAAFRSA